MVNVIKYFKENLLFILADITLHLLLPWNYTSCSIECPLINIYFVSSAVDCSDPGTPLRTALKQLHVTACTHVLTLIVMW